MTKIRPRGTDVIDPVAVLEQIAGDPAVRASVRVAAAKALLLAREARRPEGIEDVLTTRTLGLMRGRGQ
jgi:hypothetical protein